MEMYAPTRPSVDDTQMLHLGEDGERYEKPELFAGPRKAKLQNNPTWAINVNGVIARARDMRELLQVLNAEEADVRNTTDVTEILRPYCEPLFSRLEQILSEHNGHRAQERLADVNLMVTHQAATQWRLYITRTQYITLHFTEHNDTQALEVPH